TRCYRDWSSDVCSSDLNRRDRSGGASCTSSHISTTRRRYGLFDSIFREYGVVTPGSDQERPWRYQSQYGAVVAIIGERGHKQSEIGNQSGRESVERTES